LNKYGKNKMKRTIINIDEKKCNGCGQCITGCHEGALQLIDGKARLVSELFCDGLGACIGECPAGAITLEEREAEPYNEYLVMERVCREGEKVILAHIRHLHEHNEKEYIRQAVEYLDANGIEVDLQNILNGSSNEKVQACGCPGSVEQDFNSKPVLINLNNSPENDFSELTHWPVQLHLINPTANSFSGADVLLASDCSAFSMGNFHTKLLKGKSLAIACPKLDSNKQVYVDKLISMIDDAKINTLTVVIMEVPCCGGLIQLSNLAKEHAVRNIPIKVIELSTRGEILKEEWI
jgi:ferredoxin